MNLLERVLTLLRISLNSVVEQSDDPDKALQQLRLDLRNQLVQVKTQVATAIAESHQLRKRCTEKQAEAEKWLHKAEQAIEQNNDSLARTALSQYNELNKLAQRYQHLQTDQERVITVMRGALRRLEAKITEVETTLELLETRKRNALLQQRVFEALNRTRGIQNDPRTQQAQATTQDAEARAQALVEQHQRDLANELEAISEEQRLEQQLQALKARKSAQGRLPGRKRTTTDNLTAGISPGELSLDELKKHMEASQD
ncbi:phage shock protein A (PspA) family protein [Thermosporothrix hazakensis]|jgi:phage shock protein A|uniref:Phage shock protein A (PspA) family protein n=1 Tax=Thermosporothrix hazakensis TaxID=644383 RepID=A0A326UD31_THEHA|nr:PspA/IM30 family protein [Thermosporothrix hazakensis]PZW36378.1 phage shock protein A (PspA) family protein [Thermosporothrix hazakensis]GCE47027.1 hypothetical protein KTH_18960 [Thermosporothrix hazakensis]